MAELVNALMNDCFVSKNQTQMNSNFIFFTLSIVISWKYEKFLYVYELWGFFLKKKHIDAHPCFYSFGFALKWTKPLKHQITTKSEKKIYKICNNPSDMKRKITTLKNINNKMNFEMIEMWVFLFCPVLNVVAHFDTSPIWRLLIWIDFFDWKELSL